MFNIIYIYIYVSILNILVGGWPTPLKNDGVKVSWDDGIPNLWKVIKSMFQTTNQSIMTWGFPQKGKKTWKKPWNHIVFHPWHWYVSQKMKKKTWKTLKQPWKNPHLKTPLKCGWETSSSTWGATAGCTSQAVLMRRQLSGKLWWKNVSFSGFLLVYNVIYILHNII